MSFLQPIAIATVLIVVLILFFSNLAPVLPLVFLGKSTVPLPLGLLFLGAVVAGLITSWMVRLLMFWQRPATSKKPLAQPAEFSYQPPAPGDWTTERPAPYPEPEQAYEDDRSRPDQSARFREPEPEKFTSAPVDRQPVSDYVYDADYRVITPPKTDTSTAQRPPVVGSNLSPDSEDWGFDFDDEDEPRR